VQVGIITKEESRALLADSLKAYKPRAFNCVTNNLILKMNFASGQISSVQIFPL